MDIQTEIKFFLTVNIKGTHFIWSTVLKEL